MNTPDRRDPNHAILLVDGVCNFCNSGANFIIDRDPRDYFRFATIQSKLGEALMTQYGLDPKNLTSMVLIEDGVAYRKSTAALRIVRRMKGLWPLLGALVIIPPFIRDGLYNTIARNRYKLFGKAEACRLPTPQSRERFLADEAPVAP